MGLAGLTSRCEWRWEGKGGRAFTRVQHVNSKLPFGQIKIHQRSIDGLWRRSSCRRRLNSCCKKQFEVLCFLWTNTDGEVDDQNSTIHGAGFFVAHWTAQKPTDILNLRYREIVEPHPQDTTAVDGTNPSSTFKLTWVPKEKFSFFELFHDLCLRFKRRFSVFFFFDVKHCSKCDPRFKLFFVFFGRRCVFGPRLCVEVPQRLFHRVSLPMCRRFS